MEENLTLNLIPNELIKEVESIKIEDIPTDGEVSCPMCGFNIFRLYFIEHKDTNETLVFKCATCKWQINSKLLSQWKQVP